MCFTLGSGWIQSLTTGKGILGAYVRTVLIVGITLRR